MTDQTPLTAVLRAAARNSDKLLGAELAPLGLTGVNLELLAAYAETPGSSITDAGRTCNLTAQSASTATATLVSKGWITVGAPVKLRRAVHVTDPGLEVLNAAWDASRPLEKRLATLLGGPGIRRLRETVDALSAEYNGTSANESQEDPRFAQVGNTAIGLYYRALMWADARKADSVPASVVRKWSSPQAGVASRLVDAGLWKTDGDAYRIR